MRGWAAPRRAALANVIVLTLTSGLNVERVVSARKVPAAASDTSEEELTPVSANDRKPLVIWRASDLRKMIDTLSD